MGGQGIKVQVQAVAREQREAARGQPLAQIMDHSMGCVLCPRSQKQHGNKLAERIERNPQPECRGPAPEPRAQLVQRRQHLTNPLGRRFEAVEWRIAPRAEGRVTRLAPQGLNALAPSVCAIADQRVDLCVPDTIVGACVVGAGETMRVDPFGGTAATFDRMPRCQRRMQRGVSGWEGGLPPAGRAIVGRARFEQPLDTSGSRGVLGCGGRAVPPCPD
jgi:hypothetical protein